MNEVEFRPVEYEGEYRGWSLRLRALDSGNWAIQVLGDGAADTVIATFYASSVSDATSLATQIIDAVRAWGVES